MVIQIISNCHHVNCDVKCDAGNFDHGFHKNGYMYVFYFCWKISGRSPYAIKQQYPEVIDLLSR